MVALLGSLSAYRLLTQTSGPTKSSSAPRCPQTVLTGFCPPCLLPPTVINTEPLTMQAALEDFLSWALWVCCLSVPSKNTKPECASPPSNLQMPASCPFLWESQASLSQSVWKLDAFPRGHIAHNSLTACVSRDCGFLFTDQPLAPDTK